MNSLIKKGGVSVIASFFKSQGVGSLSVVSKGVTKDPALGASDSGSHKRSGTSGSFNVSFRTVYLIFLI